MALKAEKLKVDGYETVLTAEDSSVGLKAIIAIHNTHLGPSCGGIRLLPYRTQSEALEDVLRLSKGMSYKSSLAGLGFGGGKAVIISEVSKKTPELFARFGELLETLKGRYIAAKDMNVSTEDLMAVKTTTSHVLGIEGVPGSSGDPSPVTAVGCFEALRATWELVTGKPDLRGVTVALQGLGHVGWDYAVRIREAGGKLIVSDINEPILAKARTELRATVVDNNAIYGVECDVFAPCARGAIINPETLPRLKCRAIVGCANNQLATPAEGQTLWKKGIVYAPDYVVNAGGIINIFVEYEGYNRAKAIQKASAIYDTVKTILRRAEKEKTPPFLIADKMAEERLYG
ncbi:MAG: amino acid dehydrogenase [Deltaproteobacteria bacterium]|nr:amino acid dehydrogenase [Deltaproteobacteria bacterium]MBI3294828.1 amino acid dehydrogenase [Deltaproteobacteria bacterium]